MTYTQLWNTLKHYAHTFLSFMDLNGLIFLLSVSFILLLLVMGVGQVI